MAQLPRRVKISHDELKRGEFLFGVFVGMIPKFCQGKGPQMNQPLAEKTFLG